MDGGFIGRSLRRLEDRRFLTGHGRYVDDIDRARPAARRRAALAARPCRDRRHRYRGGARDARGARRLHRRRSRRRRHRAIAVHRPGRDGRADDRAAAACAGARPGAACRRPGGVRRRRHARAGARRRRAGRGRRTGRCRRWSMRAAALAPERAAVVGRGAGQSVLPLRARRQGGGRRRRSPAAAHVVEIELVNNRLVVAPIEPRAAIGHYDAGAGQLRPAADRAGRAQPARSSSPMRCFTCRPSASRVHAPDVGGGFGVKNFLYPEWVLVLWAARRLGRPVKWVAERGEDFVSSAQGRDNHTRGAAGARRRRPVSRARCRDRRQSRRLSVDQRPGQLDQFAGQRDGRGLRDPGGVHERARRLHQHRADRRLSRRRQARGQLPDRAAGRPRGAAARPRPGRIAPAQPDPPISRIAAGSASRSIAAGSPPISTRLAQRLLADGFADAASGRRRRAAGCAGSASPAFSKPRAARPANAPRSASSDDGTVALVLGTQSNGQGHETSYPQIAADLLGLPIEAFRFVQADTRAVKSGNGHGGARSMHMGGAALHQAAQMVIAKGRAIAAHLLQADAGEVMLCRRAVHGRRQRARHRPAGAGGGGARSGQPAGRHDPGLDADAFNPCDVFTFPNGCHAAEVEIDPETGRVTLERYIAIDDYGRLINPMLTRGPGPGRARPGHRPGAARTHGLRPAIRRSC